MRNVSGESCTENQNTLLMFNAFFRKRAVCEVTDDNMAHANCMLDS
jgi:hypothetical protein